MSDSDDLLGELPKKRGRPTKEETERRRAMSNPGDWTETKGGVTRAWLCKAFGMDDRTVKERLVTCPVLRTEGRSDYYEFVEASRFLVKPTPAGLAAFFRGMKVTDLPTFLQDQYWSAQRKRQIWEENAGHLWRTDAVLDVLGEAFTGLKSEMQLWVDNIDQRLKLADPVRKALQEQVDELQTNLHERLVDLPKQRSTPSQLESGEVITEKSPEYQEIYAILDDEDLVG